MSARPEFNVRLRQYVPLGAVGQIIPDMGITFASTPDGGTLQATFSTLIASSLPDDCEVAAEVWDPLQNAWIEGRDSRYVLLTQQADVRDRTNTVQITGVSLPVWMAQRAALASAVPYSDSGNVEAAASGTGIRISGSTFTWGSHILGTGDRVRITDSGSSKGLSKGSVYYVRNPGTSTFQLSHTPTGAILKFGSSSKVKMERVRTRITNLNGHQFAKNMAISVWDANANQALTNGSQYYVVNPTPSTIQVATKPGGIPVELVADALTVYRWLDGQRVWKNATAGNVLGDAFLEARDRGWGQDASGNDQVFHSWTNAGDSNSLVWPARVDDPTITGVSIGFQPGTSLWDMTTFMIENGWAEFACHDRTFDLFAPNTGYDWSDPGGFVKRLGSAAQQVQVTKDLTDYRTTDIVRGEGPIEERVSVGRSPWGVLEQYVTASGVTTKSHAISYGKTDLGKYSTPSLGYTVTESGAEAEWLPILDYQRGDWIQVQVNGTWTRLRVTQWSIAKDANGVITVTTLLEKKKRALLHKVAHASKKANGGRAAATSSTTPHESDKRKAAKPANLAVSARTVAAADKSARGTVTATWLPVTSDGDGDDLTAEHYEVVVRTEGQQTGTTVAVTKGTSVDLPAHPAGSIIAVSVRAQSSTGEWGELTDEVEYVVDLPEGVPDAPSAPTVASTLGSIVVTWDGNLVDPTDGPHLPETADAFAFVQVQRSTDQTTWTTEAQTLAAGGSVTDLGLAVGTTYFYRLVAISQLGLPSDPSPVASAAVVGVDTAQINAAFTASVTDAANAASDAQTVAAQSSATAGDALTAAQNASTSASNALTAANGKSKNTYSTSAASGAGTASGDLWFQVDASGHITAQWTWDGSKWASNLITGSVLTNLDAGAISAGTLDSARIAAASITVAQLAVTDLSNIYGNGTFAADFNAQGTWSYPYTGTPAAPSGRAWVIGGRDNIAAAYTMSVKAGDAFYIEADVFKANAGTDVLTGALWVANAAGGVDSPYSPYSTLNTQQGSGTVVDYGNGWTRRWWRFTIPTTWITVDHGALYFQINTGTAGSTLYALGNVIVRRLNGGNLIVDGSITGTKMAATAIDAMTITGATFRTASTAKTSGGVQMDSTGLHGYNASGGATFSLDTAGNLALSGQITATSGGITGQLTISGSGKVWAGSTANGSSQSVFDATGVQYTLNGSIREYFGRVTDNDASVVGTGFDFQGNPQYAVMGVATSSGVLRLRSAAGVVLSAWDGTAANPSQVSLVGGLDAEIYGGDITLRKYTAVSSGGWRLAEFVVSDDGSPRVFSSAILNRTYGGASCSPGVSGSSVNGIGMVTSSGTLGMLSGYFQVPDAYTRVESARAVYLNSSGTLGTTSSSRRTKNLQRHIKMDDKAMDAWLELPTWEFEYKDEHAADNPGVHHGLVAEEVHDAGFQKLVYYDDREGDTKGRVDGFAYERMGVYNRMAIQRLYARLQQLEQLVAKMKP